MERRCAGGKGTFILNPRVVAAGDGVYIVYSAERGRNWDVFAVPCGRTGPGKPVAVTSDPAADIKPDAAWHKDALWVAWESNRDGSRDVLLTSVRGGKVASVEKVSAAGRSNYGPSMAVRSNGAVSVAWHSFRGRNYDVFFRERRAGGSWGAEVRVTRAPTIDRHALLHKSVYVNRPEKREVDLTFFDTDPLAGYSYYYVRVIQKDGEIGWSSPVWLAAN